MTDTKLYIVLTHFDKIEQNRLRKYIRSPYFNANDSLADLYDLFIQNINKNGKAETLTKEKIWKALYPKEAFNDVRFRKLNSELLKLVEGFLAQEVYEESDLQRANYLLTAIGKKKIEKLFSNVQRNAGIAETQQQQKSSDLYYQKYLFERNYYESMNTDIHRSEKSNIESIIKNLDEFYFAEKIKWYTGLLVKQGHVEHNYNVPFIDEIIEHLKNHNYEHNPVIYVYYKSLLTRIESENEEHYEILVKKLKNNSSLFSKDELHDLYLVGLNYCTRKVNLGIPKFTKEFHKLFVFMLDSGIALSSGSNGDELSPWIFKNAVMHSLRLGEYEWVENFIVNYKDKLPKEFRDNAVSYNLALVYFYQKKFDKVIEQLQEVEYEDLGYNLSSKAMLIAIYYEKNEVILLNSMMDTFRTYLNRHKEISTIRVVYLNYISFTRKLTKINKGDKTACDALRQEIKEAGGVASEKWLLEK
ncbi:MAG: hypothetical protein HC817_16315 [Saprospiraceae bacterium]|nr:hypothetical protein [Saprospiraceae bacterium]